MISKSMPLISVQMYSGKSQREKDRLAEATTEDEVKILKVSKEEVIVLFTEATHGNRYSASVRL
jgi:4-oxalocrotonate tautomerase